LLQPPGIIDIAMPLTAERVWRAIRVPANPDVRNCGYAGAARSLLAGHAIRVFDEKFLDLIRYIGKSAQNLLALGTGDQDRLRF
jgi:hypothetical protein